MPDVLICVILEPTPYTSGHFFVPGASIWVPKENNNNGTNEEYVEASDEEYKKQWNKLNGNSVHETEDEEAEHKKNNKNRKKWKLIQTRRRGGTE